MSINQRGGARRSKDPIPPAMSANPEFRKLVFGLVTEGHEVVATKRQESKYRNKYGSVYRAVHGKKDA